VFPVYTLLEAVIDTFSGFAVIVAVVVAVVFAV
jgi:hypothetical protein